MAEKPVIMIQIADRDWTWDALHNACRMARRSHAVIALVHMIPVQHTAWLGTDWGYMNMKDMGDLADYQATVLDYGLECKLVRFQYTDFVDALVEVADHLDAQTVFARLPTSVIPAWHRFQLWWLNRRLTSQQREFISIPTSLGTLAPVPHDPAHEISRA